MYVYEFYHSRDKEKILKNLNKGWGGVVWYPYAG
jgi:hypothetical protein